MFIGHFGVAFGAKRLAPAVSLGTLFLAAQFADLLWPNLVLLGIERVEIDPANTAFTPLDFVFYPYSHSLLTLLGWGALVAVTYRIARRSSLSASLVIAALVLSHWALDVVTHRPDMPLTLGVGMRVGLGLWNSIPATIVVEGLLFAGGLVFYAKETRARDRVGTIAFWGLIIFLAVVNVANILGPPPPSAQAVAWTAQSMWLLVAWGYWVDRHRIAQHNHLASKQS